MIKNKITALVGLLLAVQSFGSDPADVRLVSEDDLQYLRSLTAAVMESSRIYPGQEATSWSGPNNTAGVLIRPGGRNAYPAFWIRDYAMSLESGMVKPEEQKHMLLLTAGTQCDQTWITEGGSMVPLGAIADHVRIDDGLPIYYPGTYDYQKQGIERFGKTPPYSDQFFFVHMAWYYVQHTGDTSILQREIEGFSLIDRMEMAFRVPPAGDSHLVFTTDHFRGVDFGFRDVITITGYLCFPSILKYRAARQMAALYRVLGNQEKAWEYEHVAEAVKGAIPDMFMDDRGMLRASTGKSAQGDVWSTALAVYLEAIDAASCEKASAALTSAYREGTLSYKGNIRHVLTTDDFSDSTAWEHSGAKKNTYQNGAYWGTPTGWVAYAMAKSDMEAARSLAKAYIEDLKETDYRKGEEFGGPYECFHPGTGNIQNPVYLTTVSCPYAVFRDFEK
jgi:hypothetical protein